MTYSGVFDTTTGKLFLSCFPFLTLSRGGEDHTQGSASPPSRAGQSTSSRQHTTAHPGQKSESSQRVVEVQLLPKYNSGMDNRLCSMLLDHFNIHADMNFTDGPPTSANDTPQLPAAVNPMVWDLNQEESASRGNYIRHMKQFLRPFRKKYEVVPVDNYKNLLDTSHELFPIELRGTSDMTIRTRRSFGSTMGRVFQADGQRHRELHDLLAIVQVKKNIRANFAMYVNQSVVKLFAADLKADGPIFAILTHLVNC